MSIYYGVDYYPEHWPVERQEIDIPLMVELGIDVVRMAEFSWQKLEPERGVYTFDWLEQVIRKLEAAGIKVILGTPTAAPPAWLIEEDPSILPIDSEGRQVAFGGRHHACQSNATLREAARAYVRAFAGRFGGDPNVIGWQIDNELGNSHHDLCHCASCEARFQSWLEAKYGSIEALNEAWGTTFWSQGYNRFTQIPTPRWRVAGTNPSQALDWKRFCSDLVVDFHREQAEILRELAPGRFITHNMMGTADKVNYFDLGEQLDFASHDQYPGGHFAAQDEDRPAVIALDLDVIRGVKDAPFWIMEQQSGITGWDVMGRSPQPGQLGMWSMQTVAHGADAVIYFRWRVCAMGTEQYWHGVLPHSGVPGRNFRELQAHIRRTRSVMEAVHGSRPEARVAMVFSYDQKYAMDVQRNNPWMTYMQVFQAYYKALYRLHIPVDIVSDTADLSRYTLVIAPLQYLHSEALAEHYTQFVEGGGTLLLTFRSGVKHLNNLNVTERALPGYFAELCGIEVPEYDCLEDGAVDLVGFAKGAKASLWADIVELQGAEALATYGSGFYAGTPALTRCARGEGQTYYVATLPDQATLMQLFQQLEEKLDLNALAAPHEGLELMERVSASDRFLFAMNHNGEAQTLKIDPAWHPLDPESSLEVPPYGFAVFSQPTE